MKKNIWVGFATVLLLISCKDNKDVLNTLADYNNSMMQNGYHFGDKLTLPKDVTEIAEKISISFGDTETSNLVIDPKFFTLGDNEITFNIKTKSGEDLNQDATINVFAKNPEKIFLMKS